MSIAAISWVFKQEIKPSSLKFVLVALADCADDRGVCWPSVEHITETTSQDRKTVIKSLDELESRGWLIDTGKRMGRTNQVKVYRLTDALFSGSKATYCDKSAENGTVPKGSQISAERVPDFRGKGTENGIPPTPPYRADPSIEPSVEASGATDIHHGEAKRIFEKLELLFSSPKPYLLAPVYAWLEWGADFQKDILPAAERFLKRGKGAPGSLAWLDEDITRSMEQRTKARPVLQASRKGSSQDVPYVRPETIPLTAEERAERRATKRRFGIEA